MRFRIAAAGLLALGAAAAGLQAPAQAAAAPTVTALSVKNGPTAGGTAVTITGTGFTGVSKVTFGTIAATDLKVLSSTKLTVRTPARPAATVHAIVYTAAGKSAAVAADNFRYWNQPVITSITPQYLGPDGGQVTIRTKEFVGGHNAVLWNGVPKPYVVVDGSTFHVTLPGAPGGQSAQIQVRGYGGLSAPVPVQYVKPSVVTGVTPQTGPAGTSVKVAVQDIYGPYSIWFGDTLAYPLPPQPGQPVFTPLLPAGADYDFPVRAPAHAPGTVDVTFRSLGGTSPVSAATTFTYTP